MSAALSCWILNPDKILQLNSIIILVGENSIFRMEGIHLTRAYKQTNSEGLKQVVPWRSEKQKKNGCGGLWIQEFSLRTNMVRSKSNMYYFSPFTFLLSLWND
ncbi:hypothetical protein RIF29_38380 [Crotalaria pallida]|uniref:Uncharacterized protein n=1 Tax=Crotalaria pallida TaxID=3830 RepID=A0AAN9E022_CROPI